MENNNHYNPPSLEELRAHEQELIAQAKGIQMTIQYNRQLQENATKPRQDPHSNSNPRDRALEVDPDQAQAELPA